MPCAPDGTLQVRSPFPRFPGELDRSTGDMSHRQRGTAARVPVELRQDDSGERQRVAERPRSVDCILALHRVDNKERLDRIEGAVQRA